MAKVWFSYNVNNGQTTLGMQSSVLSTGMVDVADLREAIWEKEKRQFEGYSVVSASGLLLWKKDGGKSLELDRVLLGGDDPVFKDDEKMQVYVIPVGATVWDTPFVVRGGIVDRSEAWIREMLPPQLPELPQNKDGLKEVLFPEQHRKIPVTKEVYRIVAAEYSELAKEFLTEADGSLFPSGLGFLLSQDPQVSATEMNTVAGCLQSCSEMNTALYVAGCLQWCFDLFKKYAGLFSATLWFNSTESARYSFFQTIEPRKRPDTIGIASGCTLLVGEDKRKHLHEAEADLSSKIRVLKKMFYGELKFILGYIAAGTHFQWMYIGKDGPKELHKVGPPLDIGTVRDRCSFLLSIGHAYQLLAKMHASIPAVPGRRAMFSEDVSQDGSTTISFFDDSVVKRIKGFLRYCEKQGTELALIKKAYAAAKPCPFLPTTVAEPTVNRHGLYRVEFSPLGYECKLESEEECRWMAQCVCKALSILHNEGLVHRDIRLPNIVRLSDTEFMLIDLESVVESPFKIFDGFEVFSHWHSEMFEDREYTFLSDMYSLGKLLAKVPALAQDARSGNEDFITKLMAKKLSSSEALQHPWLS